MDLARWADALSLGGLLEQLRVDVGGYDLLAHWKQGEFHHDVVVRIRVSERETVLVVATNCNGGIKEILSFDELPERAALWHWRCPDNDEFEARPLPVLQARVTTIHYFDPCELLLASARSELRPECRVRQQGGGWKMSDR